MTTSPLDRAILYPDEILAENAVLRGEIERLLTTLETVAQHGRIDDSESRMNAVGEAISRCRKITGKTP